MLILSDLLFVIVMALHGWFLVLEMFLWQKPLGLKTFGQKPEQAAATAVMAKNQGLYNGFLAAGIAWALLETRTDGGNHARVFFGACVVVAGVYGALTTGKRAILFIQAVPAALAILTLVIGMR